MFSSRSTAPRTSLSTGPTASQAAGDRLGLGEVEGARLDRVAGPAIEVAAVEQRSSSRPVITTVAPARGIRLGEPQPDPGRPSDDHDSSSFHASTIEPRAVRVNLESSSIIPLYHAESVLQTCCLRAYEVVELPPELR